MQADTCLRPGFSPACCAYCSDLTRRPHCYLPQFVYPGASASTPVKVFGDIWLRRCCVVCFTENEGGRRVLKGDSTLMRGQTDGLCMGYLQPGGDWGNLAVVAEVRSQGSRAKAPPNVVKIKRKQRLREGFCCWCRRESCHFYAVSRCDARNSFTLSIHHRSERSLPARLTRPRAEKLTFFFSFSPRDLRKEWTHRKDMFVLWWNASYLFLFLLTSLIATSCSGDATANQNLPLCLVTEFKHSTQTIWEAKISTYSDLTLLQLRPIEKRLHPGEKS